MKIHDENSRMIRIPDLRKGMVVEPGYFHEEQVTIEGTPEVVGGQPKEHPPLYCVVSKLDNGEAISSHSYSGDAVWVFP
jgi:hypothetical protein